MILIGPDAIALRMTGISKHFGPVQALSDVTLTVRNGTVHALVGENGAGKSTLMKILAGVYQPDTGDIEIHGVRQVFANPAQAIEAGVSMIYQELDLAEHLTVAENIYLGAEPKGVLPFMISHGRMTAQAEELARQYNFDIRPSAKVEDLATGDCQIVEILKALRRKASILVMDEPTSSLSESEARRLFEVVRRLRTRDSPSSTSRTGSKRSSTWPTRSASFATAGSCIRSPPRRSIFRRSSITWSAGN